MLHAACRLIFWEYACFALSMIDNFKLTLRLSCSIAEKKENDDVSLTKKGESNENLPYFIRETSSFSSFPLIYMKAADIHFLTDTGTCLTKVINNYRLDRYC